MSREDKSILHQLEQHGHHAARVSLKGTQRDENATDRYELIGELARGGVGIVHRGRDNDLGRDVALKVLLDGHLDNPELVQRFVEEAQIGGQLQHPGIVPVYELGLRGDKRPYFAMKLVKGETLAARLAKGTEARRALLAVFREVCRTVAYAHARGVIHRDLKPSNVMIGNFGEVQVVDWGFAKVLRRGGVADERLAKKAERDITMISTVRSDEGSAPSLTGSVMGTPAYMPPEQALGRVDDLDEKSDLFSLGAILAEILTGKPPYTGADRMGDAEQALLEPAYKRLDECGADEKLVALCRRCLQPLPKDRPATAEVLADEVAAYLTSAAKRSHRARLRALRADERAAAQRRARRLATMTGVSVAAALLIAFAAYFWIDAGRRDRARERHAKIEAALQDAAQYQAAKKWPEALAAAERAVALGDDGALVRKIRAEADAAEKEKQRRDADRELLKALEEARARRSDHYDKKVIDAAFRRAVGDAPDVDRLRASEDAAAFAAALDAWAIFRRKNRMEWRPIDAWARAIDPDNNRLRDAMVAGNGEALKRLVETRTPDELPVALISTIGQALLERDEGELAFAFLKRAHRLHPGDFWINYYLAYTAEGHFWQREARLDISIRHYTAALAVRPGSIEARHRLGIVLSRNGDPDGALAMWRDALALQPQWGHGLGHVAETLMRTGEGEKALALVRKAIERQPDDPATHVTHGNVLDYVARDPERAIEAYNRAIELDEEYGSPFYNRGNVEYRLRRYREAVTSCRRAIELGVRGGPELTLGSALLALRDVDGAIEAYREATRTVGPQVTSAFRAGAYRGLGAAYQQKGHTAAALRAYREAVAIEPLNAANHYSLGTALMNLQQPQPALVPLKRAVDLGPTAEAWCNLGSCYEQLGRWADAVEAFRKGHELAVAREDFPFPSGSWLARAEYQARVAPRFAAALEGTDSPDDWREAAAFANMAVRVRRYHDAVRLYRQAFAANPALRGDVRHYTDAACAAVAAGPELRGQALEWGRVALDAMRGAVERVPEQILLSIEERWLSDVLLAPVRDAEDLPDEWKRFWADVDALRLQAAAALK